MNRPTSEAVERDEATIAYFDSHVPEYSVGRLDHVVEFLRREARPGSSLIDLGCGVGNTLAHLVESTPVQEVAGLDVSAQCLARTRERLGCETFQESIFDPGLASSITRRFDYAIVAAVLHHLIGPTRTVSRRYAQTAVGNALSVLKPEGCLFILEPVFYPRWAMDAVFYLKKGVSRLTSRRVPLFQYWTNIGPPVVSYYTNEDLEEMLRVAGAGEIVQRHVEPARMPRFVRPVVKKTNTTLIVRSSNSQAPGP